jgi:hypothetical protein
MRKAFWLIIFVAIWLVAAHRQAGPDPVAANAPADGFSGLRAQAALALVLGTGRPHPAGSAENAAVRGRIAARLAAMGVASQSLTRFSCYSRPRWNSIPCGTVTDLAASVLPGDGPAILLMAHLDSVPAGPGAGDDGIGVATLLETIRALKIAPPVSRHPVIALFTDGEELGMLGASAFLHDPAWRKRVGVAINVDARGDAGQGLLFQTSAGDAALIDLYARSAPRPAASSLYAEIYKILPNDTDMTPFLDAGIMGYNFANIGHVAAYHTAIDTLANVDTRTLQSEGDQVLALVRALSATDFAGLKSGNAIYADVLGLWLPRLPMGWALPLALLVLVVLLVAARRRREGCGIGAILMPPALLLGAAAFAWLLQFIAAHIAGEPDPAYAHPWALRLAIIFGVLSVALLAASRSRLSCSWLWFAGLAVATACLLPGASAYFLFPALVAALVLPFAQSRPWLSAIPALAALLLWIPLAVGVETLLGLAQAPILALILAMGLVPLLPSLGRGKMCALVLGVLALIAAIGTGFLPTYDAAHPERLNVVRMEDRGQLSLIVPAPRLPASLRAAAPFSATPQAGIVGGYVAVLGKASSPPFLATATRKDREIALDLDGSGAMAVSVPKEFGLTSVTLKGLTMAAPSGPVMILCATPDCGKARMVLRQEGVAAATLLVMQRQPWQFPARPADSTPSQFGDMQVQVNRLGVPGG